MSRSTVPAYFAGDELGSIKFVKFTHSDHAWQPTCKKLFSPNNQHGKSKAVQKIALLDQQGIDTMLATTCADGTTTIMSIAEDRKSAATMSEWEERRLKDGQRYVGLAVTTTGVYSCTSNGALRLAKLNPNESPSFRVGLLPTHMAEWRLAVDEGAFAYAGDEVEVSVWRAEDAFSANTTTASMTEDMLKKRKRSDQLLPGEIWRAKNLPNDELGLRQPVRNTSLSYLNTGSSPSQYHLIAGTQFGDVRRYDTRAGRRPVANWKGISRAGGVRVVEVGCHEHEAFVGDNGSNLFALDLRNGKLAYGYKGFSGAVSSIAPSASYLASTAQDRYLRLHSTFPPANGKQQEHKGEVLDKLFMKVVPTSVVPDPAFHAVEEHQSTARNEEGQGSEDDVWDNMEDADSDISEGGMTKKRKTQKVQRK